ncbi:2730_t:CDS:1, partial [Ambispora leptoticha]
MAEHRNSGQEKEEVRKFKNEQRLKKGGSTNAETEAATYKTKICKTFEQ